MSPGRKKAQLETVALIILCLGLAAVLAVLLVQIVELAQAFTPSETYNGARVVTPTPTTTPTSTATPIPTSTSTPTATPVPTNTPTPTITPSPLPHNRPTAVSIRAFPTESISNTYPIPTPVPRYPIPEEAITIVLLGSDQRPDWDHWNTDVIQYVVVDPDIPSVAVLSIPRDLYVYLPTLWMSRINTADMYGELHGFDGGGFGLLNQTLLYNLGITADYYAKVNFQGLKSIVDILGGIEVPVHCYIQDYWPYPDENGEYHMIALQPGLQQMDGKLALWYSRTRKTTSVFDREERQQQVLEAIWRKARSGGLLEKVPALYNEYGDLVETDLGLGNILKLAMLATQIEPSQVAMYNIGPNETQPYVTVYGGGVYLPKWAEMSQVIDHALLPPAPSRTARVSVGIEIWNSSGHDQWEHLAADRLYRYGFTPLFGTPNEHLVPNTYIEVFAEHAKGTGVSEVQAIFGVGDHNVTFVGDTGGDVKLRLVLGQDYNPCR
ncbi:MAG: LCP family protein [Anaerolineae bacterium]